MANEIDFIVTNCKSSIPGDWSNYTTSGTPTPTEFVGNVFGLPGHMIKQCVSPLILGNMALQKYGNKARWSAGRTLYCVYLCKLHMPAADQSSDVIGVVTQGGVGGTAAIISTYFINDESSNTKLVAFQDGAGTISGVPFSNDVWHWVVLKYVNGTSFTVKVDDVEQTITNVTCHNCTTAETPVMNMGSGSPNINDGLSFFYLAYMTMQWDTEPENLLKKYNQQGLSTMGRYGGQGHTLQQKVLGSTSTVWSL